MSANYLQMPGRRSLLLALVAIVLLLGYARVWPAAPYISGDTGAYMDFARQIQTGPWPVPHDRLPGYPLVLIATGATEAPTRALFFVQLACQLLAAALLAWIASSLSRRAGIGLAVLLLLPPFVSPAATALTESTATVLVCAMTYFFWRQMLEPDRTGWAWASGVACALAFLVRPVFLLLGPIIGMLGLFLIPMPSRSRRLITTAGFALPCLLMGASWIGVNYVKFGYPGLTPRTGYMLFTRTLGFLERIPDEDAEIRELLIRARDENLVVRGSSHSGTMFMWDGGEKKLLEATHSTRTGLSSRMLRMNLRLIASAPLEYVAAVTRSVASGFSAVPFPSPGNLSSRAWQLVFAGLWFAVLALYLLALAWFLVVSCALLATRFRLRLAGWDLSSHASGDRMMTVYRLSLFLHVTLWYNAILSSAVEVGDPRHFLPCVPLMVLAAFLFGTQWNRDAALETGKRFPAARPAAGSLAAAEHDPIPADRANTPVGSAARSRG